MLISIQHTTRYTYDTEASYSIQSLRLTPRSFDGQKVLDWSVQIPGASSDSCSRDGFGNTVHLVAVTNSHHEIVIEVAGRVDVEDRSGVVAGLSEVCPPTVYLRSTPLTAPNEEIESLAETVRGESVIESLHALSAAVRDRVEYEVGATHAHTSAAEALADGRGVCQDHAHVFIAGARHLGLPARYVTGYFVTDEDHPSEAHHAWAEAWVDGVGWIGFDVANGLCPTERYVRLACGLDTSYAAPVCGSRRGGDSEALAVRVVVEQSSQQ